MSTSTLSASPNSRPGIRRRPPVASRLVIDSRLLRTDLDAVAAATGPPRRPGAARRSSTRAAALDDRLRAITAGARRHPGPGQRAVEGGRASCGATATSRPPRRCRPRAARSATPSGSSPPSTTRSPTTLRELLLGIPNLPHPDAPDGASRRRQPGRHGPGRPARRVPRPPAGAALGDRRRRSASSTTSGRPRSAGRCSRCRAASAPRWAGPCASYALDRNADAFEEIRPPSLVTTATLTATRPAAQVRRRRLRRSSATTCGASRPPRCRSRRSTRDEIARRGRPADAGDGVHAVLPARGRLGRPRHPGHAARPRVRQGRDPRRRHARAGARPARRA